MIINRRTFLAGVVFAGCPSLASCADAGVQRCALPPRSRWTARQIAGRRRAETHFWRRGIPRQHRDQVFEGLVYAVRQGKREPQEIVDEAGKYLQACFAEVPDWLKWLATLLSVLSSILWILLLFL